MTGRSPAGHRAVSILYQALLTGLVLTLVTRRGEDLAAQFVFRLFRRQHLEKFRTGLAKLGLDRLPDAVACAQYHYLHGWHGHNGVTLANPRLGFVCTGQTVDGHPGLEGYYLEQDRDLAPDERVRFAPGETMPAFDPSGAPRLDAAAWPPERLDTVIARYAMEYVRTTPPVAVELLGPADTRVLLGHAARLIGMQYHDETTRLLGIEGTGPEPFARYLAALARAQGEAVEVEATSGRVSVHLRGWRLARDLEPLDPAAFEAWCELWRGALAAHDRRLTLAVARDPGGAIEFAIC